MRVEQKSNGKWLARYVDETGRRRSAGTFATREEALAAEIPTQSDEQTDGSLRLRDYFFGDWQTETQIATRTRLDYQRMFSNHIDQVLGGKPLADVSAKDVRQLVRPFISSGQLAKASKVKAVIGSIYKTLIEAEVLDVNPAHGVRVPRSESDPFRSLTVAEFKSIVACLDVVPARFAQFLIGTGLRFGESTEIRGKDFNGSELLVRRRATRVGRELSPTGIEVVDATKSGRKRVVPVSATLGAAISEHMREHGIGQAELLFPHAIFRNRQPDHSPVKVTSYLAADGTQRRHGTATSYGKGCRCDDCRAAVAAYRRTKRAEARRVPVEPHQSPERHLTADRWQSLWKAAILQAGLDWFPRTHDLRHAHATMLLSSGVDIYEVQQRLGHRSIETTQIYLHRSQAQQAKAAAAADVFFD